MVVFAKRYRILKSFALLLRRSHSKAEREHKRTLMPSNMSACLTRAQAYNGFIPAPSADAGNFGPHVHSGSATNQISRICEARSLQL